MVEAAEAGKLAVKIAVDGPAASGKGTLARRLAAHFGLSHLDTGGLYRAVAVRVLRLGGDPSDEIAGENAAQNLHLGIRQRARRTSWRASRKPHQLRSRL